MDKEHPYRKPGGIFSARVSVWLGGDVLHSTSLTLKLKSVPDGLVLNSTVNRIDVIEMARLVTAQAKRIAREMFELATEQNGNG